MMKKILKYSLIALVWIGLWQLIAMAVGHELLFPAPWAVAVRLGELMITLDFYKTIGLSLLRIVAGIAAGVAIGILGGILTAFSKLARDFFAPALAVIKSTPVVSFIFLIVLWISRDVAPLIVAAMIVTPVVWANVETGFLNTDKALIEMANVYKMSRSAKIKHIYLPSIAPYFFASLRASLGMAWKAGVAAEVLLVPVISIGKMISDAKIYLETVDLFAWTVVVIILSVVIEKLMVVLFSALAKKGLSTLKGGEKID
ncbi:MAG: ABC transporter permease subunit [Clostridia bacterium]|nr:ABC transporter permease subunit [Clostridia bacterium]